jgi:hypothetical protein
MILIVFLAAPTVPSDPRSQAPEDRPGDVVGLDGERLVEAHAAVADVVPDAERRPGAGRLVRHLGEQARQHRRGQLLGGEPVADADRARGAREARRSREGVLVQRALDVLQQRFADRARLLRAVQHGHDAGRGGDRLQEAARVERPEQPDLDGADLLAAILRPGHGLVGRVGRRAHQHQDAIGVRGAHVLERLVVAAGAGAELVHHRRHHVGQGAVGGFDPLARLEEHVGVLRGAAHDRMGGRERA